MIPIRCSEQNHTLLRIHASLVPRVTWFRPFVNLPASEESDREHSSIPDTYLAPSTYHVLLQKIGRLLLPKHLEELDEDSGAGCFDQGSAWRGR